MDQPTLTESYRVIGESRYYKSADIGQVLKVYEEENELENDLYIDHKTFKLEDGLTPATKDIDRRYFRKRGRRAVSRPEQMASSFLYIKLPKNLRG